MSSVDSGGAINFPLTVIVDYAGFRATVLSRLPVSARTICMGVSAEGYHCSDEEVVTLMTDLSSKLNLADHWVFMGGEAVARSTVCGDIGVHRMDDNSVYMFSAHRLFPTAHSQRSTKCAQSCCGCVSVDRAGVAAALEALLGFSCFCARACCTRFSSRPSSMPFLSFCGLA